MQTQNGFCIGQHQVALLGQHRTPAVLLEQDFAGQVLQPFHLQGDCRLRTPEPARGFRDAAGLDDRNERAQYAHVDAEEAHGRDRCMVERRGVVPVSTQKPCTREKSWGFDANDCILADFSEGERKTAPECGKRSGRTPDCERQAPGWCAGEGQAANGVGGLRVRPGCSERARSVRLSMLCAGRKASTCGSIKRTPDAFGSKSSKRSKGFSQISWWQDLCRRSICSVRSSPASRSSPSLISMTTAF